MLVLHSLSRLFLVKTVKDIILERKERNIVLAIRRRPC